MGSLLLLAPVCLKGWYKAFAFDCECKTYYVGGMGNVGVGIVGKLSDVFQVHLAESFVLRKHTVLW